MSPTTLTAAKVAASYNASITASAGLAPYTFAISAGALPAGLTLSTAGVLSGTPTAGGVFNFTVQVTDATTAGNGGPFQGSRPYVLTVAGPVIVFSPVTLPNAQIGSAYTQAIGASGGTAPFVNYKISAGALPAGLTLSTTGSLSGTPSGDGGTFTFTVSATDSSTGTGPFTGTISYSLTVYSIPPVFSSPPIVTFQSPTVGVVMQFSASSDGGTISWDFGDGTIGSGTNVTHTYTVPGTYAITVTVTDPKSGLSTMQSISLTVYPTPIQVKRGHFVIVGKESATISGFLALPAGFQASGKNVVVTLGGVSQTFTLDSKGKGKQGASSFGLRVRKRGQTAAFSVKFYGVPLAASFNTNAPLNSLGIAQVPVLVQLDANTYIGGALRTRFTSGVGRFPMK
jgi:PKD repeat protein